MIDIGRLIWDEWNIAHIARHGVTPEEVEQVCHGNYIVRGSYQQRVMLVGPTATGRMLAVVLDPEDAGTYYPITARPASRKERRLYGVEQGERQHGQAETEGTDS